MGDGHNVEVALNVGGSGPHQRFILECDAQGPRPGSQSTLGHTQPRWIPSLKREKKIRQLEHIISLVACKAVNRDTPTGILPLRHSWPTKGLIFCLFIK